MLIAVLHTKKLIVYNNYDQWNLILSHAQYNKMAAVFHQLKFVHRFISAEKLPLVQFSTKYENVKRGKGKGRNLPPGNG